MGLRDVRFSGRGADGRRDISFVEAAEGRIAEFRRKWVVQCKHTAQSGRAVPFSELGSPTETCLRWKAQGYLLVCSVCPTADCVRSLEEVSEHPQLGLRFENWDGAKLESLTLQRDKAGQLIYRSLIERYFSDALRTLDQPTAALTRAVQEIFRGLGYTSKQISEFATLEPSDERITAIMQLTLRADANEIDDATRRVAVDLLLSHVKPDAMVRQLQGLTTDERDVTLSILMDVAKNRFEEVVDLLATESEDVRERCRLITLLVHEFGRDFQQIYGLIGGLDHDCLKEVVEHFRLEETIQDEFSWFFTNEPPGAIDQLSTHTHIDTVLVDDIQYSVEHDVLVGKGTYSVSLTLQFGSESDADHGDGAFASESGSGGFEVSMDEDGELHFELTGFSIYDPDHE